jgi:AraC family transcriptional regulator of adaptative response / DNA-3-methyladenine glycosylase II
MIDDRQACYDAMRTRDRRFDGRFFVAVRTTGIYCRPICPAPTPKLRNVVFYACAAAAEQAGFRPCRRCRPDTAPGTPAWLGTSAVVSRALRLIRAGALDGGDVGALAARVGVGPRQLRRLFDQHLGASPAAVARAQRAHFARALIDQTALPMTQVAFAAGYQSVRQFNHAVRAIFQASPRSLRRPGQRAAPNAVRPAPAGAPDGSLCIRLAYRPPLDWPLLLQFLAARAVPGVEVVDARSYRRTLRIADRPALVHVEALDREPCLLLRVGAADGAALLPVVEAARRAFDLAADPDRIAAHLGADPLLRGLVARRPGLRVPGAWDPFEVAVRGILGQQVSVRGATTLAGRLAAAYGERVDLGAGLTHLFPRPAALADADVAAIGIPRARAETIRALARAVADGALALDAGRGLADAVRRLTALPGVGAWTAQYIAMRALGEPDAFPAGDLGVRKALGNGAGPLSERAALQAAEPWRPWRAYAVIHLWLADQQ